MMIDEYLIVILNKTFTSNFTCKRKNIWRKTIASYMKYILCSQMAFLPMLSQLLYYK